jgi:hypothetical protein
MPSVRSRMLVAVAAALAACAAGLAAAPQETVLVFPGANSRATWFTIHNVAAAHAVTKGRGAKIGILDHSFGFDAHRDLYAGGQAFQSDEWAQTFAARSHHGWWMALAAREIAPEAEIYALGVTSRDEAVMVDAMVRAIDWAITNRLDALTYSNQKFTPGLRVKLDEAVGRAVRAGIVVCFIHYPHADNLLPNGLFPRHPVDDEREPDVNVLHYDYTVVMADEYAKVMAGTPTPGRNYTPFLSISSTSPVTAGFVALMRSVNPKLTPAECKSILMTTARPMTFEGQAAPRVVDVAAAVARAKARAR